jgi:hypothetical protein
LSAGTSKAEQDFHRTMRDAHNLVWLHRHSQTGQGRRHRQPSMNRAAVVLTVAAWQAFVQDLTEAILDHLEIPHGQEGHALYRVIKVAAKNSLRRFNTPNARNTLNLLADVGFDPTSDWAFVMGKPPAHYGLSDIRTEIDGWLEVRHKIAHGATLPASRLVNGRTKSGPTLHRSDAEQCIEFFEEVVRVTASKAHSQFP